MATELIANSIAVAGGALALIATALTQILHTAVPDTVASGLIGIALIAAAVALTQQNRSLLTGRGVDEELLAAMRGVIAAQPGVVDVADLFAVVVGPVIRYVYLTHVGERRVRGANRVRPAASAPATT